MSWLEQKYMNMLGSQLRNFSQKGPDLWNFSCPYCGDSKIKKNKARGYIFQRGNKYFFHCHNGCPGTNIESFFSYINPDIYNQYKSEKFKQNPKQQFQVSKPKTIVLANNPLSKLSRVSELPANHSCKKYIISRQIPTEYHHRLYYCDQFMHWTNTIIPGKFSDSALVHENSRLIIPFLDKNNNMFGYQGRALDPSDELRYISIMIDAEKPHLFGLDTVNVNQRFYAFEGPIDSMFIENSVASLGSRIDLALDRLDFPKQNCVIVYDNQPRNLEVVKNMLHAVRRGFNICIWPTSPDEKQDINSLVLSEVPSGLVLEQLPRTYVKTDLIKSIGSRIKELIDSRTYSSLQAELEIAHWRRV